MALQLRMSSLGATAEPELTGTEMARLGHGANCTVAAASKQTGCSFEVLKKEQGVHRNAGI